jgi:hypothetical protein
MVGRLVIGVAAIALTVGVGEAAAADWTPTNVQTLLTGSATTLVYASAGQGPRQASSARCAGLGRKSHGFYSGFSCLIAWPDPNDIAGTTLHEWLLVRPWSSGSACVLPASGIGKTFIPIKNGLPTTPDLGPLNISTGATIASCPPAVPAKILHGDPRICPGGQGNYATCVIGAASVAMQNAITAAGLLDARGQPVRISGCQATTTWASFTCSWPNGGSGTVVFTPAKSGWATTATLGP